ncbi:MAG: DUF2294 domain-containing protein [Solirubrobacteraceae bacterium]
MTIEQQRDTPADLEVEARTDFQADGQPDLQADGQPDLQAELLRAPAGHRSLEISNALARLHKHFVGRGPTNTRTTIDGDLVVCLLEGGYTRAEQTLEANDNEDLVAAGRLGLQDAMRQGMIEAVQEILGRRVHSFMSANDLHRNLQVEVFVLESPAPDQNGRPTD